MTIDIILSVTVVENFNPRKMHFVKFHIYVHNTYTIITNESSESLFKILLMLWKKLHLANYDITISPLQIRNTVYAEVPFGVYVT